MVFWADVCGEHQMPTVSCPADRGIVFGTPVTGVDMDGETKFRAHDLQPRHVREYARYYLDGVAAWAHYFRPQEILGDVVGVYGNL